MNFFAISVFAAVPAIAQHTITNCGKAGDHMTHLVLATSPDPVVKGQPFTVHASGVLDEALSVGSIHLDLHAEALGIINQQIKTTTNYNFQPGFPKGPFSLMLGPVTLPYLPFTNKLSGTVKLLNTKQEEISCVGLNLDLLVKDVAHNASDVTSCTTASAHMKNLKWTDDGKKFQMTGTLDEDVKKMTVNVAAQVHVGWIPVPINLDVPLTLIPGFTKGPFMLTLETPTTTRTLQAGSPDVGVEVTGNININDKNNEEIVCLKLGGSSADSSTVV